MCIRDRLEGVEVVAFGTQKKESVIGAISTVKGLSKVLKKNVDIFVCCKNVFDEEIREMFMTPCKTLQDAVDEAVKLTEKKEGEILFYPRPQTGLPVLE